MTTRGGSPIHGLALLLLLAVSSGSCHTVPDPRPHLPPGGDGLLRGGDAGGIEVAGAGKLAGSGGTGRHLSQADLEEAKSKLQHMIGNRGDAQKRLSVERRAGPEETAALEARLSGEGGRRKHRHKHHDLPLQADAQPRGGGGGGGGLPGGALDVGALEYATLHGGDAAAILNHGHPVATPLPTPRAAPPPSPEPAPEPEPEADSNPDPAVTKPPKVEFTLPDPKDIDGLVVRGMDAFLMMQELDAARKEILKLKGKVHGQQRENKVMRKELNRVESATSQVMTAAVIAHNAAITCGCPVKYDVPDVGTVSTSDITNMLVDTQDSFKGRLLQSLVDAGSTVKVDGQPLHPDAVTTFLPVVMASDSTSKSDAAAEHLRVLREGATTLFRGLVPRIKDLMMWSNTPGVETAKVERKKSCALVGNGQRMLLQKDLGEEINQHDAVLRLNQAPTLGFEQWVGNFTTWRLINAHWANLYRKKGKLALEPNCTVMVSRTQPREYVMTAKALKKRQPSVGTVLMERRATDGAGDFLRALKSRLDMIRGFPYPGKGSPSSGFLGTWLLMQLCDQVDVYGVGIGQGTSWHYFHQGNFVSSREFSDAPHHSFEFETAVLRMLDAAGLINHRLPTEVELTEGESAKEALQAAMEEALESAGQARREEKKRLKHAEEGEEALEPELDDDLSGEGGGRRKYGTGQGRLIGGGEQLMGRRRHLLAQGRRRDVRGGHGARAR